MKSVEMKVLTWKKWGWEAIWSEEVIGADKTNKLAVWGQL